MKKTLALLLTAALTLSFAGCGVFSSGDSKPAAEATTEFAITDSFTHKDPEGLEYETRYALTTGKDNPEFVEGFKEEYGVTFVEQINVIYADKDDHVLGESDYYVFATPEDAQKFGEAIETESRGGVIEDTVVYEFMDEELINMILGIDVQYNSIPDDKATTYVNFLKEVDAMISVQ